MSWTTKLASFKIICEKSELKSTIYESVGGSSHIVINFHLLNGPGQIVEVPIYFGEYDNNSYSVYRSKQSVFNMGSKLIDGFAIGNKYVAGTLIKGVFDNDELNSALNTIRNVLIDNFISNPVSASNNNYSFNNEGRHSFMRYKYTLQTNILARSKWKLYMMQHS